MWQALVLGFAIRRIHGVHLRTELGVKHDSISFEEKLDYPPGMDLDEVQDWLIEFEANVDLTFLETFCVPMDASVCSTYTRALLKSVRFIGSLAAVRQKCEPHIMRIRCVTPNFDIYLKPDQMVDHVNENFLVQRNGL